MRSSSIAIARSCALRQIGRGRVFQRTHPMNLLAILAALGLEQWHAFRWRAGAERAFVGYVRRLERKLNGGTAGQGAVAAVFGGITAGGSAGLVWWGGRRGRPLFCVLCEVGIF